MASPLEGVVVVGTVAEMLEIERPERLVFVAVLVVVEWAGLGDASELPVGPGET